MEGVLAIVLIFGGGTLFLLAISPVGKALGERIRGGARPSDPDPAILGELEQLRNDVTELQERVDFAERLLAERREGRQLPAGEP